MKRATDGAAAAPGSSAGGGTLADVLRHATLLCSELRTSNLTPKVYYELYMEVFDQLGESEASTLISEEKWLLPKRACVCRSLRRTLLMLGVHVANLHESITAS